MFFKKRSQDVRKCPNGHVLDPDWDRCPYCAAQESSDFLDESRAGHRPAPGAPPPAPAMPPAPAGPPPAASPPPASAPMPPPPPAARPTGYPPPPPPPAADDPDVTQISRSAVPSAPPAPSAPPGPPPPAPPAAADGSGPPPLVEWSDARGRPSAPPAHHGPPAHQPPPGPPPANRVPPPPPRQAGSLDEPTRVLSAAPASGGLVIAWLVAASGPQRGQDFRIPPGGARIGRLPGCGVCLPHSQDLGVSKEHAEMRIGSGSCVLVDLDSANGTFVNGERITERLLQDGDQVRLGLLEFVYKCLVL